ncbi:hypothetical protein AMTRI_Chr01g111950 [Amborella trichopoda]
MEGVGSQEVGHSSDVLKISIGNLKAHEEKARKNIVGSFCPPLIDTFGLDDWAQRGWGLSNSPDVFSLGKSRVAFVLRSNEEVARAWKVCFYRLRGSLMTLLEWNPSMFDVVSSFGVLRAVDNKLLRGPFVSFVRVQIFRLVKVPCPRQVHLQVGQDLFLIDVWIENNTPIESSRVHHSQE